MDFIKLATAFQNHIKEKQLSCGQIALYYALLNIANSSSEDWFSICDADLGQVCGLSRQGLIKAKNVLKQLGFIDFISGKGKKAPKYTVFTECTSECTTQCTTQSDGEVSTNNGAGGRVCGNGNNIYNNKTNKNITTTTDTEDSMGKSKAEEVVEPCRYGYNVNPHMLKCVDAYEQNIGIITPKVAEIFIEYINDGLEDELICLCIEEAIRANVRNINYIDKIIFNCQNEGIKTADAFRARSERKRRGKEQYNNAPSAGFDGGYGWKGVKVL